MTDERRRIDVLLDQVADQALRDRIAAEITQITGKKKWGLNFEEHLPEGIRIPKARVRRGVRAQLRDGSDPRYWEVKRVVGGVAQLHRDDGFGSGAGVTRNYTDAVRGCLFVDLSVDAGVAAGRAGT